MSNISKQIEDYLSLRRSIKELEETLKSVEDAIKTQMGDLEEMTVGGYTVHWKHFTQSRFDTTAFRDQHAALYGQFLKQTETRRFTIT